MSDLSFPEIVEPPVNTPEAPPEIADTAEVKAGQVLVKYSRTEAALADLTARYKGKKFDLTTTAGDKAARGARLELITLRTGLEKKRLELKRPAIDFGKKIDEEAKRITSAIELLEKPIDAQIRADEERREELARKEAARKATHEAGIAKIRSYVALAQGLPSERITKGIEALQAMSFGPEWEEFAVPAASAQCETIEALKNLLAETLAAEAQAVEQARIKAEHAAQQQALAIGSRVMALMGKPAAEIRDLLNLLELTVYPEGAATVVTQAHDQAVAQLKMMLGMAEQQEATAAQLAALQAAQAPAAVDPKVDTPDTPEQGSQHVLKAEAETPDATDRDAPVITSPAGGPMGAEQPAAAGLAVVTNDRPLETEANSVDASTQLLRDTLTLVEFLRAPYSGKFPTQPKVGTEWWASLRAQLDSLEPRVLEALGIQAGEA